MHIMNNVDDPRKNLGQFQHIQSESNVKVREVIKEGLKYVRGHKSRRRNNKGCFPTYENITSILKVIRVKDRFVVL